jgi:hypothetical protein
MTSCIQNHTSPFIVNLQHWDHFAIVPLPTTHHPGIGNLNEIRAGLLHGVSDYCTRAGVVIRNISTIGRKTWSKHNWSLWPLRVAKVVVAKDPYIILKACHYQIRSITWHAQAQS